MSCHYKFNSQIERFFECKKLRITPYQFVYKYLCQKLWKARRSVASLQFLMQPNTLSNYSKVREMFYQLQVLSNCQWKTPLYVCFSLPWKFLNYKLLRFYKDCTNKASNSLIIFSGGH